MVNDEFEKGELIKELAIFEDDLNNQKYNSQVLKNIAIDLERKRLRLDLEKDSLKAKNALLEKQLALEKERQKPITLMDFKVFCTQCGDYVKDNLINGKDVLHEMIVMESGIGLRGKPIVKMGCEDCQNVIIIESNSERNE